MDHPLLSLAEVRRLTYPEAVEALSALAPRGWRLGLERMQAFIDQAGLGPAVEGIRYIQVAGTNGKGSTTATIQHILYGQGWRTGGYFSPYVYDPRERVQIGLDLISEEEFAEGVTNLLRIANPMVEAPTEFEVKTALGFWAWHRAGCEWVALEVGLGGRLDATSVVTPACGVIVSIGWDHMSVLGNTLGEIASEKAGIIKPGMPVVVGEVDPEAEAAIQSRADAMEAEVWWFGREIVLEGNRLQTPGRTYEPLLPGLVGAKQAENMALAVAACERAGAILDASLIPTSVATTRIPGRFERRGRVILDGAHNLDSARVLAQSLAEVPRGRLILITGMLQGHEPEPFYRELWDQVDEVIVTPIPFHRSRTAEEVARALNTLNPKKPVATTESVAAAWAVATKRAGQNDLILVTGSFYLVGELGRLLTRFPG